MFAPSVAKAQTKEAKSQTNKLAPQRRTLTARLFGGDSVEQAYMLKPSIGNQARLRLLVQRASSLTGNEPVGDREQKILQPKLSVGVANDPLEHEADRVADQVMRMSEPEIQSRQPGVSIPLNQSDPGESIQRLAADRDPSLEDAVVIEGEEASEAQQGQVQTLRPLGETSNREAIPKGLINSSQGGLPLGSDVQQFMEPRFGADFSLVQVHADGRAAALSRALSARAFTYGQHIYFNEGEYQPGTHEGKRVLAHELTHVIQQGAFKRGYPASSR